MRLTLAALLAAALAAIATPAAACGYHQCFGWGLADDSYPLGDALQYPPSVQLEVFARHGQGLSLAGFYNDPALALALGRYRPRGPVLRRSY